MKEQAVQAPFTPGAWPESFDARGAAAPRAHLDSFWNGESAASNWQIFLDTDQNSKTGYNGGGIAVGAEYMFESDGGKPIF